MFWEMFYFTPVLFEMIVICKSLLLVIRNRSRSGWWLVLYNCFCNLWFTLKNRKTIRIKTSSLKIQIPEQKIISTSLTFNEVTFCRDILDGLWLFESSVLKLWMLQLKNTSKNLCIGWSFKYPMQNLGINWQLWEECIWIPEFCLYSPLFWEGIILHESYNSSESYNSPWGFWMLMECLKCMEIQWLWIFATESWEHCDLCACGHWQLQVPFSN